ncbi:MAG: chain-length determining protein, partial [Cohaesibacter sp.]|nr:chain-length determining protein [Cohaesibacter sp.]
LLNNARERFDYIIVDLPPVAPVVDVKAFASRIDAFVMVVEWGKTSRSLVKSITDANPFIKDKALGVVLNKADMDQMKLYRAYGSSDYYYSQYSSYYRDDNNISQINKTGTTG